MKRLEYLLLFLSCMCFVGCRFHGGGSQAIDFNPFNWGSDRPAVTPAHGFGYVDGEPLDARR